MTAPFKNWICCDPKTTGSGVSIWLDGELHHVGTWLVAEGSFAGYLLDVIQSSHYSLGFDGLALESTSFRYSAVKMEGVRGALYEGYRGRAWRPLDLPLMVRVGAWRNTVWPGLKGIGRVAWKQKAKDEAMARYGHRWPIVGEDDDCAEAVLIYDYVKAKGLA